MSTHHSTFKRDQGQPTSREDWDKLSPEEKSYWESKRRRRRHQRRRKPKPKTLSKHLGREHDGVRGNSTLKPNPPKLSKAPPPTKAVHEMGPNHLVYEGNSAEHTHFPPERLPAVIPDQPPTGLSSGSCTKDGIPANAEMKMVNTAVAERWPVTQEHRSAAVGALLAVMEHCTGDEDEGQKPRPDTAVKAISALTRMMAQNQSDEHESLKRTTLTRDQMDFLLEAISASIKSRLEDHPDIRQQIKSDLMNAMITQGLLNRD